jgi:hypothetical protein
VDIFLLKAEAEGNVKPSASAFIICGQRTHVYKKEEEVPLSDKMLEQLSLSKRDLI